MLKTIIGTFARSGVLAGAAVLALTIAPGVGQAAGAGAAPVAKPMKVTINQVSATGVGKAIGTITFKETEKGLELDARLKDLPPGEHGFHLHENPSCAPADKEGKPEAAHSAGAHFDPAGTKAHKGPGGGGHKGDLPKLEADAKGKVNTKVQVEGLFMDDIAGRSVMIHESGDNYSDTPKPLGGGGARIACGVIGAPKGVDAKAKAKKEAAPPAAAPAETK
jgi:superoxide dismutase, Cu-Zn family